MTNEELYELMKDGFAQVNQRLDRVEQRLDTMDDRLRTVESGTSELKSKQSTIEEMPDWIGITCAISALVISVAVAIFK